MIGRALIALAIATAAHAAPLEVADRLANDLYAGRQSVTATSATLTAQGTFDFSVQTLGLFEPETLAVPSPFDYRRAVLYSTLSPCDMCSGTALLYRIPRIVIGENRTFQGPEGYVRSRGVMLEIVDDAECYQLMQDFIAMYPELWNEDIGEV